MTATLLALTVTLTLSAEVIAKHGAKDEIFFGRELVERPVDNHPNGIETLFLAEEEVETVVTYGLDDIGDARMFQTGAGEGLVALIEGEENHVTYSFLEFVDVVHEHFHVGGQYLGLLHGCRFFFLIIY